MVEITYNSKTYHIANCWDDVTIRQALALMDESEFAEPEESVSRMIYRISVLSGMEVKELEELPQSTITELINAIRFTGTERPQPDSIPVFTLNGRTWVIQNPFLSEPLGKYMTIERKILNQERLLGLLNEGKLEVLPEFLAIVCSERVPRYVLGKGMYKEAVYDGRDSAILERQAIFWDAPLQKALGMRDFFLQNWARFARDSNRSMRHKRILLRLKQLFRVNGAGLQPLTD